MLHSLFKKPTDFIKKGEIKMLLSLILKVSIASIVTLVVITISKRWDPSIKPIVSALIAIGAVLIAFFTDLVTDKLSDPRAEVNIIRDRNELLVRVESEKPVESLSIDIPILGKILNIHDNNSITDAKASLKRLIGEQTEYSQNNIEFFIENIKPKNILEYKILFEPMPGNIFMSGVDRYKISYSWFHNGNRKNKTKWISFESGRETNRPAVELKGFTIRKGASTPEEIRKLYQNGLKRQDIP